METEKELSEEEKEALRVGTVVLSGAAILVLALVLFLGIRIGGKGGENDANSDNGQIAGEEEVIPETVPKAKIQPQPIPREEETGFIMYEIDANDTLYDIAAKYDGVTWKEIAELNGIDNQGALTVGEKIRIPKK